MKTQFTKLILGMGLFCCLNSFAGGGTVSQPKPDTDECNVETTIDGAHNQDCVDSEFGNVTSPGIVAPKFAKIKSELIIEGTFISEKTGQSVTLSLVANPVEASWAGRIYDIQYKSVLAVSNAGLVNVLKIVLDNATESVYVELKIANDSFEVFIGSRSHEVLNAFRQSSTLFKLDDEKSIVETFDVNLDPAVSFNRLRTGFNVRVPVK